MSTGIGVAYAVMDHFEGETGQPVRASVLKRVLPGIDHKLLRDWERQKRVDVFYVTDDKGTREKAYLRPKNRNGGEQVGEVVNEAQG
jgi:hypothetical protein